MSYYLLQRVFRPEQQDDESLRSSRHWAVSGPFATSVRAEQAAIAALSSRYTVGVVVADHVTLLRVREETSSIGLEAAINHMIRGEAHEHGVPERDVKPEKMTTEQMLEHLDAAAPAIGLGITRARFGEFVTRWADVFERYAQQAPASPFVSNLRNCIGEMREEGAAIAAGRSN